MSEPLWADVVGTWSALATAVFGLVALAAVFYVGNQIRLQRTQLDRDLENFLFSAIGR